MRRPAEQDSADAGSIAVEMVFLAPIALLLLGLVYAYGQVAQLNGTLEAGTRDAARAASQARSTDSAETAARAAVLSSLGGDSSPCATSLTVVLDEDLTAGSTVRVTASCTSSLAGLGLPGLPGEVTARSVFTSPVDPLRGVGDAT